MVDDAVNRIGGGRMCFHVSLARRVNRYSIAAIRIATCPAQGMVAADADGARAGRAR
jgi:hypothetical protein